MTPEQDRIFISYRRSDAAGTTTALRNFLFERFKGRLFHDVTGIPLGASFPDTLREQLSRSAVVLAVVGKGWLGATNEFHQRRIDFPDDWVNIELATSLSNPAVTVIPVLIDDAAMPPAKALPAELRELCTRNAIHIRHDAWDETVGPLIRRIEQVLSAGTASETTDSEVLTLGQIRQVIGEALDSRSPQTGLVLLSTIDELSRILAGLYSQDPRESKPTIDHLLHRLLGRNLNQVAGYVKEVFSCRYAALSSAGNWLSYALRQEHRFQGYVYHSCLLLLPGVDGKVTGACVCTEMAWDFYGMPSNDGLPYVSADLITGVGVAFGGIADAFPKEIPEAFRDAQT